MTKAKQNVVMAERIQAQLKRVQTWLLTPTKSPIRLMSSWTNVRLVTSVPRHTVSGPESQIKTCTGQRSLVIGDHKAEYQELCSRSYPQ